MTTADAALVLALRQGNDLALNQLVDRFGDAMVRVAMHYVRTRSIAEEIVQDTWVAVLRGIHRFEGRSSLKNWIFRILTNRAKTRGVREQRVLPFSAMSADDEPSHDLERQGWYTVDPHAMATPERTVSGRQMAQHFFVALEQLPERQRLVVELRDVQGESSETVCTHLRISQANQRVLLHRGRSRLRKVLEAAAA